jgi:Concanavalin A-like lectin/glucanases superfamily
MRQLPMSATSAAGGSITYTADTLPTGLSITGANIAGTPTVVASTTTVLTATATSTRTATRTINWVVSIANDIYFKNTTLLLNGETTVTPFISDASTNSFGLTINGDTKPMLFNPYQGDGYYGVYFDGSSSLSASYNSVFNLSTNNFTIEMWVYFTSTAAGPQIAYGYTTGAGNYNWALYVNATATLSYYLSSNGTSWNLASGVSMGTIVANKYMHVALVRNGTTVTPYIDGVAGTTTNISTSSIYNGSWPITIGGAPSTYYLTGYISNFRIVNGTAVYTSAFTPSTTPLTAITNTVLLTCQSNRFVDKSSNALTLTLGSAPQISPVIPFTASSSYSTYGSAYFDGTGDYLTAPNNAAFQFGTGDFTIECMVNFTGSAMPSNAGIFHLANSYFPATQSGLAVAYQAQTTNAFTAYYATSSANVNIGPTLYPNTWNHVALVRTGTSLLLFVNGVSYSLSASDSTNYSYSYLVMGGYYSTSYLMTGYISNFRVVKGTAVYTTAFTPPTSPLTAIANTSLLTLQYNGGANNYGIIDNSNFNNIITRNGNTSQGTFSPYSVTGWSNYFNGSSDSLSLSANTVFNLSGSFTIEAWVYVSSLPALSASSTNSATIMVYGNSSYTNVGFEFGLTIAPTGSLGITKTGTGTGILANYIFVLNTWYHVAVTYNGTTGAIYVNGVSQTLTINNWAWSAPTSPSFFVAKGVGYSGYLNYFPGYISNARIVNGSVVYTGAFTPSTSPLTPITNTVLLTCQSNRFIDNSPNNFVWTVSGTPQVQAYSPFGSISEATPLSYSTYFNGSSDYITAPSVTDPAGDFTIELWWYPTVLAGSTYYGIFVKGNGIQIYYYNGLSIALSANNTTSYFIQATAGTPTLNVWNHIAIVRNANAYTGYLNGTGTSLASSASSPNTGSATITIGAYSAIYYSSGYISNVRYVVGTAVYTANFTPSTTPLTAITNTKLLTCQSPTMIDNSTNNFAIGVQGSPKVYKYNPFGYTAQTYTTYTPSIHGGSAYFDGSGDYLTATHYPVGLNDFCFECWFYTPSLSKNHYIFVQTNPTAPSNTDIGFGLGVSTAGVLIFLWNVSTTQSSISSSSGAIATNTWYHVAANRSGTTFRIFINGVQVNSTTATANINSLGASAKSYIGYFVFEGDTSAMVGYLSDIRFVVGTAVYTSNFVPSTQTLTNYSTTYPSSLLLNFTNGGIVDQHSSNVLESVGNAQVSTAVKKYNVASMSFNGSSQYLSIPNNALWAFGTGDFTIEFWVYFNAFPSATWMVQLSQYTDNNNRVSVFFGNNATNENGLVFKVVTSSTVYKAVENDSASITMASLGYSISTWYHVAITRNGSTIKGFINGTQKCTTTTSATFPTLAAPLLIGSFDTTPQLTHNGYIDDLRITKGFARYTSNFTAPTSALITK